MDIKIVYFTNGYNPDSEGGSKELFNLYSHFSKIFQGNVLIHNIADSWQFHLSRQYISYPDNLLPFGYPIIKYLERAASLIHIYGSLTGRLYLKLLKKKPCLITNSSALIVSRLEKCVSQWTHFDLIVLESERDEQTLLSYGVDSKKVRLIYPGVPTFNIKPPALSFPFNILFASAPIAVDPDSLRKRGIPLLIETAKRLPDCHFTFLWRGKHKSALKILLSDTNATNITVIDEIVPDIATILSNAHCTILSPISFDECKPCPISLVESLACGRPVLTSDRVGISALLYREKCSVIFKPELTEVVNAIRKLQNNYDTYVKHSLTTATKHFSIEAFLKSYENIYSELGIN
jgi:glycosyltransferase involved in cell wall biosynthesis